MNRPTTYAKHAGRKTSAAPVQFDIFASGMPLEPAKAVAKPRKKAAPRPEPADEPEIRADWATIAIEAVRLFALAARPGEKFTMEKVRTRIEGGLQVPRDLREWGTVTRLCVKRGILAKTGTYAATVTSHGSPKPLYRRGAGVEEAAPRA